MTLRVIESDELDVESIELTDILAFYTEHKEEFETLLVDEEENYQRDVKSLLKLFVDIVTPGHSNKNFESSQKLRKDGIGIWKNFTGNMLSNYIL